MNDVFAAALARPAWADAPTEEEINAVKVCVLPGAWHQLGHTDFHPDLIAMAKGVYLFAEKKRVEGDSHTADLILGSLEVVGEGYARKPDLDQFDAVLGDGADDLRQKYLCAVKEFYSYYRNRLPAQLYETLAYVGTRQDPTIEKRLPDVADEIPCDWRIGDAAIHALTLGTGLLLHFESIVFKHTNHLFQHGCGCNHVLPEPDTCPDTVLRFTPPREARTIQEYTENFARHHVAEIWKLVQGLPHDFGLSQAATRVGEAAIARSFLQAA